MDNLRSPSTKILTRQGDLLQMELTDLVSVFDWGPLAQSIPGKGKSCARIAWSLNHALVGSGFRTAIREYDGEKNFWQRWAGGVRDNLWFIPLEIVFRLKVAPGSSYGRRHPEVATGFAFDPINIEFWTKRERVDRLLTPEGAAQVMAQHWSMDHQDPLLALVLNNATAAARGAASVLGRYFAQRDLEVWDGKFECAWDPECQGVVFVDAVTPDELRITKAKNNDQLFSKELIRRYLRQTEWYKQLQLAKLEHGERFAEHCPPPPLIPPEVLNEFSSMYQQLADWLETRR